MYVADGNILLRHLQQRWCCCIPISCPGHHHHMECRGLCHQQRERTGHLFSGSADGQEGPVCLSGAAVQHQLPGDCHCHSSSLLLWHQRLSHCKHPYIHVYTAQLQILTCTMYMYMCSTYIYTYTFILYYITCYGAQYIIYAHTNYL